MVELRRLEAEDHSFSLEKAIARAFLPLLVSGIPSVRHFYMEPAQVHGIKNLVEVDGTPLQGPALWLLKHESKFDFVAAAPLWKLVPGDPLIKGVSRDEYSSSKVLSRVIRELMRPLFIETYRLSDKTLLSDVEKQQLRDKNRKGIERLQDNYHKGIHVGIAPEGVSKSDGRIPPIRSGAYNLSHIEREDGVIERVPCVAVGNTYDFMVGEKNFFGRRKYAVFFNFGKPFFYEPVVRDEDEPHEDYIKRDIQCFAEKVELAFLDLNTITASQLVGNYIIRKVEQKRDTGVTPEWMNRFLAWRVEQLSQIEGLYFDNALLTQEGRERRVGALFESLQELGYISGVCSPISHVVRRIPEHVDTFKDNQKGGNILLYSANRLRQVAEVTPAVNEVLRTNLI